MIEITIPETSGNNVSFKLEPGDKVFLLGANGAGKSSLVSHLFVQHKDRSKRISAHRQTWFQSNTMDMTPKSRDDFESNTKAHDQQPQSRYFEWNPTQRATMTIFDLIDADTVLAREIAKLVRDGDLEGAKDTALTPSPIQEINELFRLSNIPIEITIEDMQRVMASRNGGPRYSIAALSDGERNAFLIAASVMTAPEGSLLIIDEPERHLHRAIVSPLLTALFEKREDCAFIVSTHELGLPIDNPASQSLLVRGCEFSGDVATKWTIDFLPNNAPVSEELRADILGGRRNLLFIEGTTDSIDLPIYSLLFPDMTIIPKEGCRDVENAVKALRSTSETHWVMPWGIVDRDRRSEDELRGLKASGVYALEYFSVESLYYHPDMIALMAERVSTLIGESKDTLCRKAISDAIDEINSCQAHLVLNVVARLVRQSVFATLPEKGKLEDCEVINIEVPVSDIHKCECQLFNELIESGDLKGLVARYPVRQSGALKSVAEALNFKNCKKYEAAVLTYLQDSDTAEPEFINLAFQDIRSAMAEAPLAASQVL